MTECIFILFSSPSVGRKHQKMAPQLNVPLFFFASFFYLCGNDVKRKVISLEDQEACNHSF